MILAKGLDDLALLWFIGIGAFVLLLGLSFAAFVLKMACRTVGVEVPDTGKAMVISFLETVACGVAYVLALMSVGLFGTAVQAQKATMGALAAFSIFTLAFAVPGGLYVPLLRVSFGKGLVIALLRYVITFTIYALIGFAIISLGGGKKGSRKWSGLSRDNLPLPLQVVPHDIAV